MPRSGKGQSDDRSPGDGRERYSDIGGVEARHAQTHDVRREQLTNPTGPDRSMDEFADDIAPATPANDLRGHVEASSPAAEDKALRQAMPELSSELVSRLSVVNAGTQLEQGGTYLDLNDRERGPFKALGGQSANQGNRYVAKKDTDYELWNELVGDQREPQIARPTE
jgi:hypothetical protein